MKKEKVLNFMSYEMNYGDSIKNARKKAGLTQKELAEKAGLAEITIRQYETNKREPRSESLKKIATALEIPLSALLDENYKEELNEVLDSVTDTLSKLISTSESSMKAKLIENFDKANSDGKKKIFDYSEDIISNIKYCQEKK